MDVVMFKWFDELNNMTLRQHSHLLSLAKDVKLGF